MKYRALGRTGLTVSEICLGCMSFGSSTWWGWVLDEETAGPFFRKAVEQGITFFDTADSYSDGRSEEITGRWLKEYARRDETVIATKVFFGPDRPNMKGLGRKHIEQACEGSLRRLQVEVIDLYQIHRYDPAVPIDETLEALDRLVQRGLVRYLGASSMYAYQFARALGRSHRNGWSRFVAMQNHYNLLYREEEREMAPLCVEEGVGMIPWSPLARGLLSRGPQPGATARGEDDRLQGFYAGAADAAIIAEVAAIAAERGTTATAVALAWLLAKPGVTAPIVGASRVEHVDAAVAAVDLTLSDTEMARLEAPYVAKPVLGTTPPYHWPAAGQVHDRGGRFRVQPG